MGDIRVLIVDDSPTVCSIFRRGLERADGITVIGTAPDPYVARDMIVRDPPDVVTLDIEMPRMDGLTFLRKLMKHFPLPVVVVSTLTQDGSAKAVEALQCGAVEVVAKNLGGGQANDLVLELVRKVRAAAGSRVSSRPMTERMRNAPAPPRVLQRLNAPGTRVLLIGSSTGGTDALAHIFARLPANTPGTLVVQHMPPGFTAQMAQRLDRLSAMTVREAEGGEVLQPGLALIAPGDRHLLLRGNVGRFTTELRDGPKVSRHKPSVDVLFRSGAAAAGAAAIGVILTGMGRDGAQGMAALCEAGAHTIAQDEASCVVWGMPRAAVELGVIEVEAPLDQMPETICRAVERVRVPTFHR
jgi:two-component system chemotaxis response regulator CheB